MRQATPRPVGGIVDKSGRLGIGREYSMDRLILPAESWILVCDGSKALIFQNKGDALQLNLQLWETKSRPDERTRDVGTDRPGRSFSSVGKARSAVEGTDWHEIAEREFLGDVADGLELLVRTQKVRDLVVVAPARALGVLRTHLGQGAKGVLKAEISKDLCKLPTPEIEAYFASMRQLP